MLGEGVDAAPSSDHDAVEELLRAARPLQPQLPDQQQNRQEDPVRDERTAHDVVRKALAEVVVAAVSHHRYSAEEHLNPAHDWQALAEDAVRRHNVAPDASVEAPLEMKL